MNQLIVIFFARYPALVIPLAALFGVPISILGFNCWQELRTLPSAPATLSLQQSVGHMSPDRPLWVSVSDARWDCRQIVNREYKQNAFRTHAIFANADRSIFGVAEFSENTAMTCADLQARPVAGFLQPMDAGDQRHLEGRGLDLSAYETADARVTLCTFCSRTNTIGLLIFSIISVPFYLGLYPYCLFCVRKKYLPRHDQWRGSWHAYARPDE